MVHIERTAPTPFWERHPDWGYAHGLFRDVAHGIGHIGEFIFWLQCENRCELVATMIPDWFPLSEIRKIFVMLFRRHYEQKHERVYDEWALQACKFFETVEGALGDLKSKVESEFNALLNDAKSRLQSQLDELNRLADRFRSELNSLESAKNKLLADVDDLDVRLRKLEAEKLGIIKVPSTREVMLAGAVMVQKVKKAVQP